MTFVIAQLNNIVLFHDKVYPRLMYNVTRIKESIVREIHSSSFTFLAISLVGKTHTLVTSQTGQSACPNIRCNTFELVLGIDFNILINFEETFRLT